MGLKTYFSVFLLAAMLLACKPVIKETPGASICDPNDKLCIPPSLEGNPPATPTTNETTITTTPTTPETPVVEVPPTQPTTPTVPTLPNQDTVGLPRVVVTETGLVSLADIHATDPDSDTLTYTYTEPLNKKGEWQTKVGDAGEYLVTITASDGKVNTTQKVLIIVKSKNKPPVIGGLSDLVVDEGQKVTLTPIITDEDNDPVTVRYSGWLSTNNYQTTFEDAGTYFETVTASDGKTETSKQIKITVRNVNRAPVLASIAPITVIEGSLVTVRPIAIDQDGDPVTYTFDTPLDQDGKWQTRVGDAGSYSVNVAASDGVSRDVKKVTIVVQPQNRPPVLTVPSEVTVNAGDTVRINAQTSDPDGDQVTVTVSGWMTSLTKVTTDDDGGQHAVIVTASDGKVQTSKDVTIIVNRAPIFQI